MDLSIRTLSLDEVALLVDWAAEEGWNPGLHDAPLFQAADPDGFIGGFVGDDLLVGAGQAGGVYRSTGDSYQRISDGALVAWGTDGVVVRVCGQTLECNLERIDLGTGATTSYEVAEGLDLGGLWWVDRPTSPELDAHLAISSGAGSPVIYEVGERTVTELPITSARSVAWSAANQWLLIGGANELLAFHIWS